MQKNKKGFTFAELLIVVAIIGVLVAISIPIFTSQLEKSREATDLANLRSAYAAATAAYLDDDTFTGGYFTTKSTFVATADATCLKGKGTATDGSGGKETTVTVGGGSTYSRTADVRTQYVKATVDGTSKEVTVAFAA